MKYIKDSKGLLNFIQIKIFFNALFLPEDILDVFLHFYHI